MRVNMTLLMSNSKSKDYLLLFPYESFPHSFGFKTPFYKQNFTRL
jgi:hypothetical protein